MPKLEELNNMSREDFTRTVAPVFEHSPWIAARTCGKRPFATVDDLHAELVRTVTDATESEKLALICAHPDLAERAELTKESEGEQASAGLATLSESDSARFHQSNLKYRKHFGFPFVICARMNNKQAMLDAFSVRLQNSPDQERETALGEIFKIAKLRLADLIDE